MSNPIQDYELIKIIQSHPILYDKDMSRGTRNARKKDEAWRLVSLQLNASERACITRWKSIRDRFGKEYRRVLDNTDEPVTWDMFPHLMFLKNHYKHGSARNDELPDIRYEPKRTKHRERPVCEMKSESNNEVELDDDERYVNRRIIQLVKEREVIYDKLKIRDSKNLTAKNDAWEEISESIGISEESCYKRWKKLRDRFARECRKHQIHPNKPVEWEYFNDMIFLTRHYRKGVPLDVNNLKRCGRPPKNSYRKPTGVNNNDENQCVDDSVIFKCTDAEQNSIPDDSQDVTYLDFSDDMMNSGDEAEGGDHSEHSSQILLDDTVPRPEEQLCAVIDNMEAVLQQSQECLQSLRQQKQIHQNELNNAQSNSSDQPLIVQKMNILLEGLDSRNRSTAEAKILQFLCECQIKSLNNQKVDDVRISNIQ